MKDSFPATDAQAPFGPSVGAIAVRVRLLATTLLEVPGDCPVTARVHAEVVAGVRMIAATVDARGWNANADRNERVADCALRQDAAVGGNRDVRPRLVSDD